MLAIADDGTVATEYSGLGLVEIRADAKYRIVDPECRPESLRYAGNSLFAVCGRNLRRWDSTGVTDLLTECDGTCDPVFSPRGERFACCTRMDDKDAVAVFEPGAGVRSWVAASPPDTRALAVTDTGVAFAAAGEKGVVAIADGKAIWETKAAVPYLVYEPTRNEIVGWNRADERFDVFRAVDGARSRRTPPAGHSLREPIAMMPDGSSWLAIASDSPGALTRWDAVTGKVLAKWEAGEYASGATVSPNGRYAAASNGQLLRVDLTTGKASTVERVTEPSGIASSRSGDRIVIVDNDGRMKVFDAGTGKELKSGPAPDAISRNISVAYAPDGKAFAIANAYGELRILDAQTLQEKCHNTEEIGATSLFWSGNDLVAVYAGNFADDEQYLGGSVTVVDPACKVKRTRQHDGFVSIEAVDDKGLDLIFEAYEPPPYGEHPPVTANTKYARAVRVTFASGTMAAGNAALVEKARLAEMERSKNLDEDREIERVVSLDGRTTAIATRQSRKRTLSCRDTKSNDLLVEHVLPSTAWREIAIAGDGSWVAVPDGPSVLVYPCRKTK